MHIIRVRRTAGPKLKLISLVGNGPTCETVSHARDEVHGHIHPSVFSITKGIPIASVGDAVMIFFKIPTKPRIVIANPANGFFKVVVGVFETFVEDVASKS